MRRDVASRWAAKRHDAGGRRIEPPKPVKGENVLLDGSRRLRRRVRELKADDAHHRERAISIEPRQAEDAGADRGTRATQGAPSASLLVEHDGEIIWPTTQRAVGGFNAQPERRLVRRSARYGRAVSHGCIKDALIAALDREIDAEADDKAALSHEAAAEGARPRRWAILLAVERDESGAGLARDGREAAGRVPGRHQPARDPASAACHAGHNGHLPETTAGLAYDLVRPRRTAAMRLRSRNVGSASCQLGFPTIARRRRAGSS